MTTRVFDLFAECEKAIRDRVLIRRPSATDKEFHFQNWVRGRLESLGLAPRQGGRNSFPDFVLPKPTEGYEVKGLEYPGRYLNYDSNSQPPTGAHGDWAPIYYVFGRYPKGAGTTYPVTDLVVCHGDFLNATHDYVHKNRHVKGFGSYGDIMIRDRKMYVVPTPYALCEGVEGHITLIVPEELKAPKRLVGVGELLRREAATVLVGHDFSLRTNEIGAHFEDNPNAGREHRFRAYRHRGAAAGSPVSLRDVAHVTEEEVAEDNDAVGESA